MNRKDAIREIYGLAAAVASEFATSAKESDEIYGAAEEAMRTLGVTQGELDADDDD